MKTLDDFNFKDSKRSKYDWDTIFNGRIYELTHNIDFSSEVKNFRIYVLNQAKKRNIEVQTQISGNNLIVKALISDNKKENSP